MKVIDARVKDVFRETPPVGLSLSGLVSGALFRLCIFPRALALLLMFLICPSHVRAEDLPVHAIQNIFDPRSTPSEMIYRVAVLTLIVCAVIFVIVAGLLTYAIVRYRHRGSEDDKVEPPQVYGSAAIELAWTVPPVLIVVVLVLVTARTIGEVRNARPPANNEEIRVVGHRFWWEVHYPRYHITTANEIHVPLNSRDEPGSTDVILESADVAHGFWVAQLSGKSWLVPNYRNEIWMRPFETGIYLGNCSVFCGDQHANMLIRVVVQSRTEYIKWLDNQQKTPGVNPAVEEGRKQFISNTCGTCHRIEGQAAGGIFGPDLTHFMSRQTLGAGVAPNDEQNLRTWLKDPQILKPGCLMPNMKLSPSQVEAILTYLRTLQ
jgi:cytochrome c oxidase subunit II